MLCVGGPGFVGNFLRKYLSLPCILPLTKHIPKTNSFTVPIHIKKDLAVF